MLEIILGWISFVALVATVVIRPWGKPARRAPLPMLLSIAAIGWVLWRGADIYADLIAQSLSTAATIAIPFVPLKALFFGLVAYVTGRALMGSLPVEAFASKMSASTLRQSVRVVMVAWCAYLAVGEVQSMREVSADRLARDPNLTAAQVSGIVAGIASGDISPSGLSTFLGNPLCPPELLERYATGTEVEKTSVARNPKLSSALAEKLATDPNPTVRYYIAVSDALSLDTLSRLSHDTDSTVRATVVWMKRLPDADFERLVSDPDEKVRSAATQAARSRDAEPSYKANP